MYLLVVKSVVLSSGCLCTDCTVGSMCGSQYSTVDTWWYRQFGDVWLLFYHGCRS